jgi:hypothetical protein
MKRKVFFATALCLLFGGMSSGARADLSSFLESVNVQAKGDIGGFPVRLSAQFGVPLPRVETILREVESPADAFMCLQLGEMTRRPPEAVLETYKRGKGQGWGAIAKDLGIKPGSPEFHALKRGDFVLAGGSEGKGGGGKGKGKGKKH